MSQVSQLSPELTRGLLHMARALLAAVRNWALYPPEHPTLRASVDRLAATIRDSTLGAALSIGVTPDTLMIEGTAADAGQAARIERMKSRLAQWQREHHDPAPVPRLAARLP